MKKYALFILFLIAFRLNISAQVVAGFTIPDTVCVNQTFAIQNTTTGGSTYYWNFCSGNLSNNPIGINMGNLGTLNKPVYSAIVTDSNKYYVFITNNLDGTLTRLSFGNSLINTPVATNLGTLGVLSIYVEGIQIKKDSVSGNWIGWIAWGQDNCLARLNFGNSLNNIPTAIGTGNIGGTLSYPHSIYLFQENNNWYGIVSNYASSTIVRLSFGTSLSNTPTAINLGNIGSLNGPTGLYPILDNGTWYLFVVSRDNSTLSRLNFGTSLLNTPTGINLGNINNTMNYPRSITILRDCNNIIGFFVNETTNDIVRLTFPGGVSTTPTGVSLGNIANFSFPHSISQLFRVGDSLYCFIMNVNNNTISRLCFPSCANASIASSTLQNPPPISYNTPGTYNINLTVDEGLPTQATICKQIVVVTPPTVNLGNDTSLCVGNSLTLNAGNPGATYLWSTGATTQQINVTNSGTYWVTVTNGGSCTASDTININYINPVANFSIPDTVCINTSFNIQNLSTCASSYYWNFCSGNLNTTPQAVNLGNIGLFNGPVFVSIAQDSNSNYYVFASNNTSGTISRMFFGNSLLNTPTAVSLGNLGGCVPPNSEDINILNVNGNWYGFMTGGYNGNDALIRMNFGNSLTNTPTCVSFGNIGGMDYPQRLQLFQSGANWYGFTVSRNGNTMTRFSFGNSLTNTPTGYNYGNIGTLNIPDAFSIITVNNNWYAYIINEGSNTLTRLDFGNSLLNIPVATNIGNPGALNGPRGITVFTECDNIVGLITNRYSNDLVSLNFTSGPTGPIIGTSLGNLANFSFPHSIERFRVGDTLYAFIPNVSNNTISRIFYPSCNNSSIPSSTLQNPPPVSYNTPGIYEINLTINEGLPSQTNICKQIVVVGPPMDSITGTTAICSGDSIKLYSNVASGYSCQWSGPNGFSSTNQNIVIPNATIINAGYYKLIISTNGCSNIDSIYVNVISTLTVNLGNDTTICQGNSLTLNAGNTGATYLWNTNATTQQINVNSSGTYWVKVTNGNCQNSDTINITVNPPPVVSISNDTTICKGQNVILSGSCGVQNNCSITNLPSNLQQGLVAFYPFCGNANDMSGNGHNGTVTGATLTNDRFGNSNSAYNFNGNNNYITVPDDPALKPTQVSISVWVKLNSFTCTQTGGNTDMSSVIFKKNTSNTYFEGYMVGYRTDLNKYHGLASNSGTQITGFSNTVTLNVWNHIVLTVDSTELKFYENGVLLSTVPTGFPLDYANIPLYFGSTQQSYDGFYNGVIDDIFIYNRVITNAEVLQLYNLSQTDLQDNYSWSTGDTTQSITVAPTQTTTYYLTVSNGNCSGMDSVKVSVFPSPVVNLGNDTNLCIGNTLTLDAGNTGSTYLWNTNATTQQINVSTTGSYWVKVTNSNGCTGTDTINVTFSPLYVNIGNDTTLCFGDTITLNAGNAGGTYLWNTGFTTQTIKVWNAGSYWVQVNWGNCNNSDTININTVQKPVVNLGNDTIMCPGGLIVLSAGTGFTSYLWSNGSTQSTLNVNNPGTYWVTVSNNGCLAGDSIIIAECNSEIWIPNCFTPNGDGINDTFYPVCTNIDELTMYVYNRWGNEIFEGKEKAAIWDGTYKGKMCSVGVYYYLIIYQYKGNGHIEMKELHGSVTLLR